MPPCGLMLSFLTDVCLPRGMPVGGFAHGCLTDHLLLTHTRHLTSTELLEMPHQHGEEVHGQE